MGLLGISYYACGQWMVASLRPPHLAAILPWQGTCDFYRDRTRHGGIFSNGFVVRWWEHSVLGDQHGNLDSAYHDIDTGERNTGPDSLTPGQLAANRVDYIESIRAHPLLDAWYRERSADLSRINVPALVVANWGGLALHLRGTVEGFRGIASRDKWLKVQSGSYFHTFFTPDSVALQRRFFDRYLKGADNGWEQEPRVEVTVRAPDNTIHRQVVDTQWPLTGTRWTRLYLDAAERSLGWANPTRAASASYAALGEGVTFTTPPLDRALEFAGPLAAHLHVSCSAPDMDLFATVVAFDPQGQEITFLASTEPKAPVSQGWPRVTQRKIDPARSTEYRPYHTHDEAQPLTPGEIYAVDVEIWPASLHLPAGYRLGLVLQGKDYERNGLRGLGSGSGNFVHDDPVDRPPARYAGDHTMHTGAERASYLVLPALPGE